MNVVAGAVAFVEVAIAAEMEEVEFVNEAVAFQEIYGAIDGYLSDARVQFAGAFQDFAGVQVAAGGFHYLK